MLMLRCLKVILVGVSFCSVSVSLWLIELWCRLFMMMVIWRLFMWEFFGFWMDGMWEWKGMKVG